MPPVSVFLGSWSFDPWATAFILAVGGLYLAGLLRNARANRSWPVWRIVAFYVLGLGLFAFINFGFLGSYSSSLRWAFALRISLLLFVVPAGLALGLPVALARQTLPEGRLRSILAGISRWPMRVFSNSAIAPIVGLLVLSLFLTPLAGIARISPGLEGLLTVIIPLLGLLMVLPLIEEKSRTSTAIIMVQFVFAFIELLLDAVPGLVMRLSGGILDGVGPAVVGSPTWFPHSLGDQQLGGDFLWFIAEIMDLPVLILLFIRFSRSDKGERKVLDELTDEQMDELNRAHLESRN